MPGDNQRPSVVDPSAPPTKSLNDPESGITAVVTKLNEVIVAIRESSTQITKER